MKKIIKLLIKIISPLIILGAIILGFFLFNVRENESGNNISVGQKKFANRLKDFAQKNQDKPFNNFMSSNYDVFCFVDSYSQPSNILKDFIKKDNMKISNDFYLTENFWAITFYSSDKNVATVYDFNRNNLNSSNQNSWCQAIDKVFVTYTKNNIQFIKK